MRDQVRKKKVANEHERGEREALAAVWPRLMEALGNFPPTPAEIERIRLFGPPSGHRYLPRSRDRWTFRTGEP